jgi:hypothetical protein
MTNHVPQPQLCADCLNVAHALAETGPPSDRVIKRCSHGADGVVIAVGSKIGGRICHWHCDGPMDEAQADVVGARILMQFAAAGMVGHDITRQ